MTPEEQQLVNISSRLERLENTVADMSATLYGDGNRPSITEMIGDIRLCLTDYISEARGRADERRKLESKFRWIIGIILTAIGLLITALQANHQIRTGELALPFRLSAVEIYNARVMHENITAGVDYVPSN